MAITANQFNGMLNSNEIYNSLFNIKILFQKIVPQSVRKDEIVSLVEKATGMYGDTGVIQGMDIQGTYDFLADQEASKLLQINRNKTHKIEKFTIDSWRQTDVTNDAYISKRAFLDENTFSLFNSYIVGTLNQAMDAYESGFVKTSLGTYVSDIAGCNIEIELQASNGTEAIERIRAAKIREAILNLKDDMKDNQRKYNGYKFYSSYDWEDFTAVFNTKYSNEINSLALYNTFNPEYLSSATEGRRFTPKWFGNVLTTDGVAPAKNLDNPVSDTTVCSLIECNSDGSTNFPLTDSQISSGVVRLFPGDILPNSFAYKANEAYQVDTKIIAKVFAPEYVYYMTGYQQGESFYNPRSSTTNHYLRKGFSKVQVSKFRPYITIREKTKTTTTDK